MKRWTLLVLLFAWSNTSLLQAQNTDWTYIPIDSSKQKWGDWTEPEWLRYFGLDAGDVNRDGCLDIISGRYIYHSPCGDLSDKWSKIVLDDNVDAILFMNVDDDVYADIIAQALPDIYWYEALNEEATLFRATKIAEVPATSHVNSQGFEKAQLITSGKEEILIAGNGNIYCISIPEKDAEFEVWKVRLVAANTSDEGIGIGDIDGDGDLDIAAGRRPEGEGEPKSLVWFEQPDEWEEVWKDRVIGKSEHPIDRVEIADLNGDGKSDVIVTEERYPGLEPDGHFLWFEQGEKEWEKHIIVQQYSMNNLDIADLDQDGDIDLVTNEHKGQNLELQLWENDGKGNFSKQILDTGKENHLGTQLVDMDGDGDLDIIGTAWDNYKWMHLWRNDAVKGLEPKTTFREYTWTPTMVKDEGKFLRVGGKLDYSINNDHFPSDQQEDGFIRWKENVDLSNATHAKLTIERVQSHEDTKNLRIQINDSPWLPIPEPALLPANATDFMFHSYPTISVPIQYLKSGNENRFRLKVDEEQAWNWPQNLIYGLTLQIFSEGLKNNYQENYKEVKIKINKVNNFTLSLLHNNLTSIKKVDYIGRYEDVNWQGEGIYRQWQYNYHKGELRNHIGTKTTPPFSIDWSMEWLPNQDEPIEIIARIHYKDGTIATTEISRYKLSDRSYDIQLIKPYKQPSHWVTRNKAYSQYLQLPEAEIQAAKLYWRSWSPCYNEGIEINGYSIDIEEDAPCYDYYEHEVEVENLNVFQVGENRLTTLKTPLHDGKMVHGMEVQWPGVMLKVKTAKRVENPIQFYKVNYEDRPHFLIAMPTATYYYDLAGGGFSRIIDQEGNDWIGFKREPWNQYPASAASAFRGLPNLVFQSEDGGAGHPGFNQCISEIEGNSVLTTSKSGKWQWRWTFEEEYAVLELLKTDEETPYWFLYEGTVAGTFAPEKYYFGTSKHSSKQQDADFYKGTSIFGNFQWAYFGQTEKNRIFYLIQAKKDEQTDLISYLGNSEAGTKSKDGMTVFGFGRGENTKALLEGKQKFIFGFHEAKVLDEISYDQLKDKINDIIQNENE